MTKVLILSLLITLATCFGPSSDAIYTLSPCTTTYPGQCTANFCSNTHLLLGLKYFAILPSSYEFVRTATLYFSFPSSVSPSYGNITLNTTDPNNIMVSLNVYDANNKTIKSLSVDYQLTITNNTIDDAAVQCLMVDNSPGFTGGQFYTPVTDLDLFACSNETNVYGAFASIYSTSIVGNVNVYGNMFGLIGYNNQFIYGYIHSALIKNGPGSCEPPQAPFVIADQLLIATVNASGDIVGYIIYTDPLSQTVNSIYAVLSPNTSYVAEPTDCLYSPGQVEVCGSPSTTDTPTESTTSASSSSASSSSSPSSSQPSSSAPSSSASSGQPSESGSSTGESKTNTNNTKSTSVKTETSSAFLFNIVFIGMCIALFLI